MVIFNSYVKLPEGSGRSCEIKFLRIGFGTVEESKRWINKFWQSNMAMKYSLFSRFDYWNWKFPITIFLHQQVFGRSSYMMNKTNSYRDLDGFHQETWDWVPFSHFTTDKKWGFKSISRGQSGMVVHPWFVVWLLKKPSKIHQNPRVDDLMSHQNPSKSHKSHGFCWLITIYGYGSIPIHTIFRGTNIHLPAILMWTTGVPGSWPIPICHHFPIIFTS